MSLKTKTRTNIPADHTTISTTISNIYCAYYTKNAGQASYKCPQD